MPWNITFFFASTRMYVQDLALSNDYIKCSPVFWLFIFLFLSLFFLQKKVSPSLLFHSSRNKWNQQIFVLLVKKMQATWWMFWKDIKVQQKYFKRYEFWKIYNLKYFMRQKKKQNKSKTTLLTHNAVVSILMESSENNNEK